MKNQITKSSIKAVRGRISRGELTDVLQALSEVHGGIITPVDVVEEAAKTTSKLHHLFDWNDSSAASKYRLMQARILLTTVKVQYLGAEQEQFFNATVIIDGEKVRGYFPIERVMTEADIHRDVLRQAVAELEYAQKKYESLKELRGLINTKKLAKIKKTL